MPNISRMRKLILKQITYSDLLKGSLSTLKISRKNINKQKSSKTLFFLLVTTGSNDRRFLWHQKKAMFIIAENFKVPSKVVFEKRRGQNCFFLNCLRTISKFLKTDRAVQTSNSRASTLKT